MCERDDDDILRLTNDQCSPLSVSVAVVLEFLYRHKIIVIWKGNIIIINLSALNTDSVSEMYFFFPMMMVLCLLFDCRVNILPCTVSCMHIFGVK